MRTAVLGVSLPPPSGEWRLDTLRWRMLRASLDAQLPNPQMAQTARNAVARVPASGPWALEALGPQHDVEGFDCGREELNLLLRDAVSAGGEKLEGLRTFVVAEGENIAAFYSARPVVAIDLANSAARATMALVSGIGVARDRSRPGFAEDLIGCTFLALIRDEWGWGAEAILAFALTPAIGRIHRRCGGRLIGKAIHPLAMIATRRELESALSPD